MNIARALMGAPTVLLVDEPTAALDNERSASIVGLLRRVTHEFQVATVMVTHDTEFVPLTDAVAAMRDGGLAAPAVTWAGQCRVLSGRHDYRADAGSALARELCNSLVAQCPSPYCADA